MAQDFVRTLFGQLGGIAPSDPERAFAELRAAGEAALRRDRFTAYDGRFAFAADLRYRGQEHTIPIPVEGPQDLTSDTASALGRFNVQHDARYGHAAPDQSVEIVNLRLVVTVPRADDAIGGGWRSLASTETAPEHAAPSSSTMRRARSRRGSCGGRRSKPAPRSPAPRSSRRPIRDPHSPRRPGVIDRFGNIVITLADRR